MNSSELSYEKKQERYYTICFAMGTFMYYLWKFLVDLKAPGFEPFYFRTPSLLFGILFFSVAFFKPSIYKYSKHMFFINSIIVMVEFFYMIYLYCDSFLGLFYFMGGFVVVTPHLMAWRNKKYLNIYGAILTVLSSVLFLGIYLKTKIFENQAFDYIFFYSTAFGVVWFLNYIHLINEEAFKALEEDVKQKDLTIIKASRLASLGEVTGGLAHEINNPLQILNLSLEIIKDDDKKNNKIVEQMDNAVSRISGIVDGLKFFSGKSDQTNKKIIEVKEALDKAINVIHEKLTSNNIEVRIYHDKSRLLCQELQLSQVFLSLLTNACDSIIKSNAEKREIIVEIKSDGSSVKISVSDSGDSINPKIIGKIFDPFFTTKPVGQGSGLGLSIAKGIIEQHNGEIQYLSDPKSFEIVFKTT